MKKFVAMLLTALLAFSVVAVSYVVQAATIDDYTGTWEATHVIVNGEI